MAWSEHLPVAAERVMNVGVSPDDTPHEKDLPAFERLVLRRRPDAADDPPDLHASSSTMSVPSTMPRIADGTDIVEDEA